MQYRRDILNNVLIYHQRKNIGECICGWSVLGALHAEHICDVYEATLQEAEKGYAPVTELTDDPVEWKIVEWGKWQNLRNPTAFSTDGGVTYYDFDDIGPNGRPTKTHKSRKVTPN